MTNFLPFENFYILSPLKPDEVEDRIQPEVGKEKFFRFGGIFSKPADTYFEGTVSYRQFEIRRIIVYRNSFLPRISGTVENNINGSRVHIKMRLPIFAIIFMCFWMGIVGIATIVFVFGINSASSGPAFLIPLGMLLFGYVLMTGAFKFESIKAKNKLLETLEGYVEKKDFRN